MGNPDRYYAKTVNGWTFIVLDSGDSAVALGSENSSLDEDQLLTKNFGR